MNSIGDFTLIDFPHTYFGAQNHDLILIQNISTQISTYVALGEVDEKIIVSSLSILIN